MSRRPLVTLFAAVALAGAASAHADTLGAAAAGFEFFNSGQTTLTSVPLPLSSTPFVNSLSGPGFTVIGSVVGGTDPAVSAGVSGSQATQEGVASTLEYQFEVNGPSGQVQIGISGFGQTAHNISSTVAAFATLVVGPLNSTVGPVLFNDQACSGMVICSGSASFNVNQEFDISTNTAYQVFMEAFVLGTDAQATAFADPTITLDTDDPAYSLEFSPGLSAATPEPSSFLLVGTGLLCGVGAMRRRYLAEMSAK